jgi:hypothetical protein
MITPFKGAVLDFDILELDSGHSFMLIGVNSYVYFYAKDLNQEFAFNFEDSVACIEQ